MTATAGGTSVTSWMRLTTATPMSFSVDPMRISGGDSATGTVTIKSAAPAGGTRVRLTSEGGDAIVPASKPNDADLGGASGVLAIAMNSIKLVDYGTNNALGGGDDPELELLGNPPTPVDLNFAATSGSNVGSFASSVPATAGTYEALKITVDDVFRIKCAVTCSGTTYRTQGSSTLTSPDSTASPAQTSSISLTGSDTTATFPFATPFVVTDGDSKTKTIGYAASGACELWNISGGVKIMPANLSASIQ